MPDISVVIPTRDRSESVRRVLRALALQGPPRGDFEAIVVADGCTDSTARQITAARWPFDVHVLEQSLSGAAVARNCGAALARGEILLFLDDEVEPEPGVLRAHATVHASTPRAIGLGYLPPIVGGGLFGMALRGWREDAFDGPRCASHRFSYRDLQSGHFSIPRTEFDALRGFDRAFGKHADLELAYRAIEARVQPKFVPDAVCWRHETADVDTWLRRQFDVGMADVQLAGSHPELIRSMPVGSVHSSGGLAQGIAGLGWRYAAAGDRFMAGARKLLDVYERCDLRFRWCNLLERMIQYWYWRGVGQALQSRENLATLLARATAEERPEATIDLAVGVDSAARVIDTERPRSVRLVYGSRLVGEIPHVPGSERLRSPHLRRALARELGHAFAAALPDQQRFAGWSAVTAA
jgi:GT2 family glycosyltransferase